MATRFKYRLVDYITGDIVFFSTSLEVNIEKSRNKGSLHTACSLNIVRNIFENLRNNTIFKNPVHNKQKCYSLILYYAWLQDSNTG